MPTSKKTTKKESHEREWVKAARIAAMFDVSVGSVYQGSAGMDQIRFAYLGTGAKAARRWYLPDAIALKQRMLQEATEFREQMTRPFALGPYRRRRRSSL